MAVGSGGAYAYKHSGIFQVETFDTIPFNERERGAEERGFEVSVMILFQLLRCNVN
jgi:hypothetical protein